MAQKGSGKRKQAPAYSTDMMALRYMAGLALIALGVVIFLAVELRMPGNIFEGLRRAGFGLCGIMVYVLPVLPLWAGALVIWSTQRRAPVLPWLYALLAFFGLCAFMMITGAMDWLDRQYGGNWGAVINGAYTDSAARLERASGGGAAGAALAWPLWKYLGQVLGTAVIFALTLLCILLAMNLAPSRLRDIFTGQAGRRREQQKEERARAEQQQVAWQQQQAAQQAAWYQQQAQIIEQQQQYAQQQAQPQQPTQAQQPAQPWPDQDTGVRHWQEQMAAGQPAAQNTGHRSRIFDVRPPEKQAGGERPFLSRIFGKKEEYDGLVDEPVPERKEETGRVRRTATGREIGSPQTHWAQEPGNGYSAREETRQEDGGRMQRARQTADRKPGKAAESRPVPEPVRTERTDPEPDHIGADYETRTNG